jgi:hypothetical protein
MKWLVPIIAAFALAVFSLSIPAAVFSTKAEAGIMNGKGNCSGGVCTQNKRGAPPAATKSKSKS